MTRLQFQLSLDASSTPNSTDDDEEEEEEDEERDEEVVENGSDLDSDFIRSPLISAEERKMEKQRQQLHQPQFSVVTFMAAALRKSLVTCSVDPAKDVCSSMDIGWPTDVRHIAHVTFDRFNGFLGLPVDLEPEVSREAPSASVSIFGVSPNSMQCSYDNRGNSVPTILLLVQKHLYSHGGLRTEGIFRINGESSQELQVREQLNKGIIPHGVDSHCLASLIKAWFRELPTGVLDCLTPDQLMLCTKEECSLLAILLPPAEAALLNWAINLMADVVENECYNKMNARNIAMVFAPNMTQMDDPLTALIHAVQVMNFLKTLILKTVKERGETIAVPDTLESSSLTPTCSNVISLSTSNRALAERTKTFIPELIPGCEQVSRGNDDDDVLEEDLVSYSPDCSPAISDCGGTETKEHSIEHGGGEGFFDKLSSRKGGRKLWWHPVFHFSKSLKKSRNFTNGSSGQGK